MLFYESDYSMPKMMKIKLQSQQQNILASRYLIQSF